MHPSCRPSSGEYSEEFRDETRRAPAPPHIVGAQKRLCPLLRHSVKKHVTEKRKKSSVVEST
jgi:hypothetical protein